MIWAAGRNQTRNLTSTFQVFCPVDDEIYLIHVSYKLRRDRTPA